MAVRVRLLWTQNLPHFFLTQSTKDNHSQLEFTTDYGELLGRKKGKNKGERGELLLIKGVCVGKKESFTVLIERTWTTVKYSASQ